jgi:arylsulfatase A-like enzyme
LELAGVNQPKNITIDGVSLLPILQDSVQIPIHDKLCWRSGYNRAIRSGNWKLITDDLSGNHALYDLSTDKVEQVNLYDQKPEIVDSLKKQHAAWEAEMKDPSWPRVMDFRWWDGDEPYYFPL